MKLELITLSLFAAGSSNAFAPNTGRRLALSRPGLAIPPAAKTLRFATADGTLGDTLATADGTLGDSNADNEVERLRAMAKKLREEATTLATEQSRKVSESTQKAFSKFDLNKDGTISVDELKAGLEKAFKQEIPESRIKQLVDKFDQNGDGILQMNEFVSVDKMRNQLDALIREEKGIELEESKRVQQAEESEKLREMRVAILNDGEPTKTDKIVSVTPYVLPLLDSLLFVSFFATKHPDNVFAQIAVIAYSLYRSIPFSGFLAFFGLSFVSSNPSLNRLVRFNAQQAIYLDIALFVPGFLSFLYGAASSNLNLNLPTEVIEYGSDAVVLAMIATIAYASVSSLLGKTPDKIPFASKATQDRMISPTMFDKEGRFIGKPRSEDEEEK
jgi:hypothetical protein